MKKNYSKDDKHLTERERVFVLQMAQHGDATKAIHESFPGMSDQAARVLANQLMKRKDILRHVQYIGKRFREIDEYVRCF